jgi:hypothetical protein
LGFPLGLFRATAVIDVDEVAHHRHGVLTVISVGYESRRHPSVLVVAASDSMLMDLPPRGSFGDPVQRGVEPGLVIRMDVAGEEAGSQSLFLADADDPLDVRTDVGDPGGREA